MTRARSSVAVAVALMLAASAAAAAERCPLVPAGLSCAALSTDDAQRRAALVALDDAGRDAAARGDYAAAAQAFGCLVAADPTPESAGNLAVVLREQGLLGDALLVAVCAEGLAPEGAARDRARGRREEIERRLGLGPASPRLLATAPPPPEAPPPATRPRRKWGFATLALGAVGCLAAGGLYALARDRARAFADEQLASGFSPRARSLRDESTSLQTWSWISLGTGVTAVLAGGALVTF